MSMNVYSLPGSKIVCINNSETVNWMVSAENSRKLELNGIYTVEKTDVHNWFTEVYIKEIPGIAFNSVWFDNVK